MLEQPWIDAALVEFMSANMEYGQRKNKNKRKLVIPQRHGCSTNNNDRKKKPFFFCSRFSIVSFVVVDGIWMFVQWMFVCECSVIIYLHGRTRMISVVLYGSIQIAQQSQSMSLLSSHLILFVGIFAMTRFATEHNWRLWCAHTHTQTHMWQK